MVNREVKSQAVYNIRFIGGMTLEFSLEPFVAAKGEDSFSSPELQSSCTAAR